MSRAEERVIHAIAARQHGVVTRSQLRRAGVGAGVVEQRLRAGALRPLCRGVYLVGPIEAPSAREQAAILAGGESAVLSHRTAARRWEILTPTAAAASVEIAVTRGNPRGCSWITVHRTLALGPDEVTTLDGMPITTPTRTVWDLAGVLPRRELENALARALDQSITNRAELLASFTRYERRPGASRLRQLLEARDEPALTQSEAEDRLRDLLRAARLPLPQANALVEGYRVDCYWRSERLVVEVDGYAFHSSRAQFEADHRRDSILLATGIRVMRVTWTQIVNEPLATVARIARALAQASRSSTR